MNKQGIKKKRKKVAKFQMIRSVMVIMLITLTDVNYVADNIFTEHACCCFNIQEYCLCQNNCPSLEGYPSLPEIPTTRIE